VTLITIVKGLTVWALENTASSVVVTVADRTSDVGQMEERVVKNFNNCLNTDIYSYIETPRGQSYNLYLIAVQFFNTSVN
jgi:hypothetical protein